MGSWGITDTSIEGFAAARNDMTTLLDELKLLDKNPTVAAEKASLIIYKLAQGKGKKRSKNYEDYTQTWRTIIFSAGEISLTDNAKDGGVKRMLGDQVRIVDIPADAGCDMGIYESLPDGFATSGELAEKLNESTLKYYGTAQPAFLRQLTKELDKDRNYVSESIKSHMNEFLVTHKIDGKVGHVSRKAKRFALAYASGVFAIKFGVLPFTIQDVMKGVTKCYFDSLKASLTKDQRITIACNLIDEELNSKRFLDLREKEHGYSCDELKSARVLKTILRLSKPLVVKIIPSAQMLSLIPEDDIRDSVLEEFRKQGRLLYDTGGRKTRSVHSKLPNCGLPRGYYFKRKLKEK